MQPETPAPSGKKWMKWVGWIMTLVPTAMLLMGVVMAATQQEAAKEGFVKYGYPEDAFLVLVAVEAICALLYVVPQTSVLGAILVTGYLGGAVATHVRASESNWYIAVTVGVLAWGGLFLRDPRIRALIPLRKK